jgi:hypothetical protein
VASACPRSCPVFDENLRLLSDLTGLDWLAIKSHNVTNAGLNYLS